MQTVQKTKKSLIVLTSLMVLILMGLLAGCAEPTTKVDLQGLSGAQEGKVEKCQKLGTRVQEWRLSSDSRFSSLEEVENYLKANDYLYMTNGRADYEKLSKAVQSDVGEFEVSVMNSRSTLEIDIENFEGIIIIIEYPCGCIDIIIIVFA